MTYHPFAQIALNGNPKSQEIRPCSGHFLQNRLLQSPRFARHLNGSANLHGRLKIAVAIAKAASVVRTNFLIASPP